VLEITPVSEAKKRVNRK